MMKIFLDKIDKHQYRSMCPCVVLKNTQLPIIVPYSVICQYTFNKQW